MSKLNLKQDKKIDLKPDYKPVPKKERQRAAKSTPYIKSKVIGIRWKLNIVSELGVDRIKKLMEEAVMEEFNFKMSKKGGKTQE